MHDPSGQLGRIAVIGGSEDYTGAPYFSAMASARLGCDMVRCSSCSSRRFFLHNLVTTRGSSDYRTDHINCLFQSHVICTPGAAAVIKTYSPNLMVHPLMRQSPSSTTSASSTDEPADTVASRVIEMLSRLHVLVIGPGLGRDPLMQDTIAAVISAARKRGMPVVLDADALLAVQKDPGLVKGYRLAVLTPNVVEFGRLCKALGIEEETAGEGKKETDKVEALARALDGVTIVQKGFHDFVSDGETTLTVDLTGGKKRSGGQGDTLTGSIATFLGWRGAYLDGLWDHGGKLEEGELVSLACFGGCAVTRVSGLSPFYSTGNQQGRRVLGKVLGQPIDPGRSGSWRLFHTRLELSPSRRVDEEEDDTMLTWRVARSPPAMPSIRKAAAYRPATSRTRSTDPSSHSLGRMNRTPVARSCRRGGGPLFFYWVYHGEGLNVYVHDDLHSYM